MPRVTQTPGRLVSVCKTLPMLRSQNLQNSVYSLDVDGDEENEN